MCHYLDYNLSAALHAEMGFIYVLRNSGLDGVRVVLINNHDQVA